MKIKIYLEIDGILFNTEVITIQTLYSCYTPNHIGFDVLTNKSDYDVCIVITDYIKDVSAVKSIKLIIQTINDVDEILSTEIIAYSDLSINSIVIINNKGIERNAYEIELTNYLTRNIILYENKSITN